MTRPNSALARPEQMIAPERAQSAKKQTRYTYTNGPMMFLGQQIVRAMQDQGYPSKIYQCYRDPDDQMVAYYRGNSKAKAYESPHQYFEAVDIIHQKHGWNVSHEYWDTLQACVEMVSEKYGVKLNHGHTWKWRDSAHIEIRDWRSFKHYVGRQRPTQEQLAQRFEDLLPQVWKQYKRSKGASATY